MVNISPLYIIIERAMNKDQVIRDNVIFPRNICMLNLFGFIGEHRFLLLISEELNIFEVIEIPSINILIKAYER